MLLLEGEGNVAMCLMNNHAMNTRGMSEVWIYVFLISALDGSCHLYDLTFIRREEPRHLFDKRLRGPQQPLYQL
jgi:hypothetical protein